MEQGIRNSAKAIIIRKGQLLLTKNSDHLGEYFLLPGGGQHHGETLHQALKRECREEIGTDVCVGELRLIREYLGKHHEFAEYDIDLHQIEYMFECEIPPEYSPVSGIQPDGYQIDVMWVDIHSLSQYRIYPSVLKELLLNDLNDLDTLYLGDVN
jgi:8-oxo-dGTP pyrophosphatase MutT (NUDIX family)